MLLKSVLEERGFAGCLDLDDIRDISSAGFDDKVRGSVAMLALLNDETSQSQWCVEEWQLARRHGVPIVAVFNQDEHSLMDIRDMIAASRAAFPWLFDHQTVCFTSTNRRAAFDDLW